MRIIQVQVMVRTICSVINQLKRKVMMKTKKLIMAATCLTMIGMSFTACSNDDAGDNNNTTQGKINITLVGPSFAEETTAQAKATRATNNNADTTRVILQDGLLIDGTVAADNTAATRATEHEPITGGNGIVLLCESGSTTIAAAPQVVSLATVGTTTDAATISLNVPKPSTSYDVYIYWAEKGGLTSDMLSSASVGSDISGVALSNRPAGVYDDYGKITIAGTTTTGGTIHLTPIGSKASMTMNAGVAPITAFSATITSYGMTNVSFTDGTYTVNTSSTADVPIAFTGNSDGGTIYKTTGTSDVSARYIPPMTNGKTTAEVHIASITGPSGETGTSNVATTTYDSKKNTMKFDQTYANGYQYNFILNLATPIWGYEGNGTGTVLDDVAGASGSGISLAYSGSAKWPALCGRPQYYEWDAKSPYPTTGTAPSSGDDSYFNSIQANNQNPGKAKAGASNSCKNCPTYIQTCWYLSAGTYWDGGRWYCPNGFLNNNVTADDKKDILVHTGGMWLKKISKISGYSATKMPTSGLTDQSNTASRQKYSYKATIFQTGKPGVVKLKTGDTDYQSPNDWFFLPAAGMYGEDGKLENLGVLGRYWSSVPWGQSSTYAYNAWNLYLSKDACGVYFYCNYGGRCLWSVQ
jgi:hypothetical protein